MDHVATVAELERQHRAKLGQITIEGNKEREQLGTEHKKAMTVIGIKQSEERHKAYAEFHKKLQSPPRPTMPSNSKPSKTATRRA